MEIIIIEIIDKEGKKAISREVLNDLPEWSGLSESTEEYTRDLQAKPFLAAYVNDESDFFNGYKKRISSSGCWISAQ